MFKPTILLQLHRHVDLHARYVNCTVELFDLCNDINQIRFPCIVLCMMKSVLSDILMHSFLSFYI